MDLSIWGTNIPSSRSGSWEPELQNLSSRTRWSRATLKYVLNKAALRKESSLIQLKLTQKRGIYHGVPEASQGPGAVFET